MMQGLSLLHKKSQSFFIAGVKQRDILFTDAHYEIDTFKQVAAICNQFYNSIYFHQGRK